MSSTLSNNQPNTASTHEEPPWKRIALFLLTLAVLVVVALLLQPFFTAIVGAIVLAVIAQRPYNWLASKVTHPTTCAAVAVVLVALAVIVPSFFLAQSLGRQALSAVGAMRNPDTQHKVTDFIADRPALADTIQTVSASIDPGHVAQTAASAIGTRLAGILRNSFRFVTQIVVMLFLLFFLFRDRDLALSSLRAILPLHERETDELFVRTGDAIYATALGRLAIACVQGLLAGLAFWALGVPAPMLWAFTTVALAMIPAFGSFLVWAPIAIFLGLSGHWGKAVLLAVWGGLVVSTIDNILYPILVGTRLRTHTAIILLSILGGIALFGVSGIILGPVVFTIAATLLEFWHTRTSAATLNPQNPA